MSDVLAGQVLHLQWNAYSHSWGPVLRELRAAGLFQNPRGALPTLPHELAATRRFAMVRSGAPIRRAAGRWRNA